MTSRTGRSSRTAQHAGFTLIEVLLTAAVVLVGAVAILQAYVQAVAALEAADEAARASILLDSRLALLDEQVFRGQPAPAPIDSAAPPPDGDFRWSWRSASERVPGGSMVDRVSVSVWREGGRSYAAATYLPIPEPR
jgi:prepilin-type N-terminal cleavage/methylation domain-containing protein